MTDDNLIDTMNQVDIDNQLKTGRKKMLVAIVVLIIFNTVMFTIFIKGSFTEKLLTSLNANLFSFNVVGFILGSFVAIFPYKGLGYNKKYVSASLLSIVVLQTIMAIGLILIAFMTFAGWY